MIDKIAVENLSQELQDVINTFIIQANIAEQYDLDFIPNDYAINLLNVLSKYPEHNELLNDLMYAIMKESE